MISPIEKKLLQEKVKAMTDEQRLCVAEMIPSHILFGELYRRDQEKDTIISSVKEAFNVNMRDEEDENKGTDSGRNQET